jgi:hypothetical protein
MENCIIKEVNQFDPHYGPVDKLQNKNNKEYFLVLKDLVFSLEEDVKSSN